MILEVKNLSKTFGEKKVLNNINLKVESGKALGFLGRNGAGKSTTIKILMNLFKGNEGEILLNGVKFEPKSQNIGYLPEERGLYPKKKVEEQVRYFAKLRGLSNKEAKKNTLYWLEKFDVLMYKDIKLEKLSKGNQQKVQLAQTFVCNPNIIILDEPFSGLDPINSLKLKEVIRESIKEDKIVIFSSHQMSYVEEFCDEIALINEGEIILSGNLKNIKREYGKNRYIVKDISMTNEELKDLLYKNISNMADISNHKDDYLLLESKYSDNKTEILKEIIKLNIDIEKFGIYEPSLEDIFIERNES